MTTLFAITFANRLLFLKDFIASFENNTRPNTRLVLGTQGCHPATLDWLRQKEHNFKRQVMVIVYPDNIGLNRYDDLVNAANETFHFKEDEILVDTDDDAILVPGIEDTFSTVLSDSSFGWVGYNPVGAEIFTMQGGPRWKVGGLGIISAAVGGGLAATRFGVWQDVGGFGQGTTLFDLEDARFQRKCLGAGYRCGIIADKTYEHHGGWDWHIKYGTHLSRMDSLHEAMLAGVIDDVTYRGMIMEYSAIVEAMSEPTSSKTKADR